MGEMNRNSLRRLATAEHHAAARRAANVRCGSAAPAPPVLRRHAAAFTVLRSPARSLDHVITAAGQPSVRSMAPSSNPHGTALPGLVGGSSARTMLARAPSPPISFRESDPATPAERVRSGLLPARPPRSARPRRPADGRAHRSRRSQGCCVGQGCFVGTTRDHRPVRRRFANGRVAGRRAGKPSRVSCLLRMGLEASTATVSWLPTTYTSSMRFPGLHSLLVSPICMRATAIGGAPARPSKQRPGLFTHWPSRLLLADKGSHTTPGRDACATTKAELDREGGNGLANRHEQGRPTVRPTVR